MPTLAKYNKITVAPRKNAEGRLHFANLPYAGFRVIKRQFGFTTVRYRGLAKNTARLHSLFALANLYLARRRLLATAG